MKVSQQAMRELRESNTAREIAPESPEIALLRRKLAAVEVAVTSTAGDADRSEFHRGWAACCKMVSAVLQLDEQRGNDVGA